MGLPGIGWPKAGSQTQKSLDKQHLPRLLRKFIFSHRQTQCAAYSTGRKDALQCHTR